MMLLKVPTQIRTEFLCPLCGHRAQVDYHDPAPIDEREPVPGKDRHAREQAIREANGKLEKQAQKALRIVPCPACGKIAPAASRRALLKRIACGRRTRVNGRPPKLRSTARRRRRRSPRRKRRNCGRNS